MENEYIVIQRGDITWHIPTFRFEEDDDEIIEKTRLEEPKHARWDDVGDSD